MKTVPLLTLGLAAAALLVHLSPALATALQFDRTAVAEGEWWRLFTGHLAHFNLDHLAWDLGVFLTVGWVVEARSRFRVALSLGLASVAISTAIWFFQPQFDIYRGLSGLDCALFGLFAAQLLPKQQIAARGIGVVAIGAIILKSAVELATGSTVFASGLGYAPVPLAHLVGALSGALVAMLTPKFGVTGAPRRAQGLG